MCFFEIAYINEVGCKSAIHFDAIVLFSG